MLLATNTGVEQNIVELMYNSTPQLEIAHTTWIMQGGQQDYLMIHFMPREYIKYNEKVSFLINGLDTMSVWVHGEGTPLIVELVDQSQKLISFDQVHMGEVSIQKVSPQKIVIIDSFQIFFARFIFLIYCSGGALY